MILILHLPPMLIQRVMVSGHVVAEDDDEEAAIRIPSPALIPLFSHPPFFMGHGMILGWLRGMTSPVTLVWRPCSSTGGGGFVSQRETQSQCRHSRLVSGSNAWFESDPLEDPLLPGTLRGLKGFFFFLCLFELLLAGLPPALLEQG